MIGLSGIFDFDGAPADGQTLARMSARLRHRGAATSAWVDGHVGLACQADPSGGVAEAEAMPLRAFERVVVFDGRLDNREELLLALPEAAPDWSDQRLLAAAHRKFGSDCLARLRGDFALALFDTTSQELLLARDAVGMRPLYFYADDRVLVFASEIKALLLHPAVPRRPNDDLLAAFLLNARNTREADCTFFDRIFTIQPGHFMVADRRGHSRRQYFDFDVTARTPLRDYGECVAEFGRLFRQAVRRRTRSADPVAVMLSGGVDSSSILCTADALRQQSLLQAPGLRAYSHVSDSPPADETYYLDLLERHCSIEFRRLPIQRASFLKGGRECAWAIEFPLHEEMFPTGDPFFKEIRQSGARVVLSGLWADQVLFTQSYLVSLCLRLRLPTVWKHLQEYPLWFTDAAPSHFKRRFLWDMVSLNLPQWMRPTARRLRHHLFPRSLRVRCYSPEMRRRAAEQAGIEPARFTRRGSLHAESIYVSVRHHFSRISIEYMNKLLASYGLEMAFPFLDQDLLVFLMSLPGELQTHGGVPKALLRDSMAGILPPEIAGRRWKGDGTAFLDDGLVAEHGVLKERFDANSAAARFGYISEPFVRQQLSDISSRGPGCKFAWRLGDLVGLEDWLEVFFDPVPTTGSAK